MKEKNIFNENPRDLAPEIWSLAREKRLGELRQVYYVSKRDPSLRPGGWVLLGCGFGFLIFALFALFVAQLYLALLFSLPGFLSLALPLVLIDLLFLIPGSYLVLPQRISARWHVSLWEAGFLYAKGSLRQVFRWDQIESIQGRAMHAEGRPIFTYKVRRRDGCEVNLNHVFLHAAQLIDIVLEECSRQMSMQELNLVPPRDRTFADFKLNRQGISDKQGALAWHEMQELTIENGTIAVLKRAGDFLRHELGDGNAERAL